MQGSKRGILLMQHNILLIENGIVPIKRGILLIKRGILLIKHEILLRKLGILMSEGGRKGGLLLLPSGRVGGLSTRGSSQSEPMQRRWRGGWSVLPQSGWREGGRSVLGNQVGWVDRWESGESGIG